LVDPFYVTCWGDWEMGNAQKQCAWRTEWTWMGVFGKWLVDKVVQFHVVRWAAVWRRQVVNEEDCREQAVVQKVVRSLAVVQWMENQCLKHLWRLGQTTSP
jgi:hypothetical protein